MRSSCHVVGSSSCSQRSQANYAKQSEARRGGKDAEVGVLGTEQLKPRKLYKLSAARHEQGKRRIATRRSCGVEFRCYLGRKLPRIASNLGSQSANEGNLLS